MIKTRILLICFQLILITNILQVSYAGGTSNISSKHLDILLKNEENDYYLQRLKNGNYDYFYSGNNKLELQLIGFTGGSHLGTLYMLPLSNKNVAYRLDIGGSINITTKEDSLIALNDNEFIVTTNTGGTGTHHNYDVILKYENNKIEPLVAFPINGYDPVIGSGMVMRYKLANIQSKDMIIKLQILFEIEFGDESAKERTELLNQFGFTKNKEIVEITIDANRNIEFNGANSIKKHFDRFLDKNNLSELIKIDKFVSK
jgi:hypothetical protein